MTVTVFQFSHDEIELLGASVYSFMKPELRVDDPLPVTFDYFAPSGRREGRITISFIPEESILFEATLGQTEEGTILRPSFTEAERLSIANSEAPFIAGFQLHSILGPYNSVEFRDFWEASKTYQQARNIIEQDMKGALYLYKANASDSSSWRWIMLLGR